MEVQSNENDSNLRVQDRAMARCDELVVFGLDVTAVGRVRAADERDILGAQFLLDASFTNDEYLALVLGELEDARDVY